MRKYKVTVEAEITLEDYMDEVDLLQFNNTLSFLNQIDEEEFQFNEYKFTLELDTGVDYFPANINKVNIKEITNENS